MRQLLLVTLTFLSVLPADLPFVTAWHPGPLSYSTPAEG